jgi:hypothetical protein
MVFWYRIVCISVFLAYFVTTAHGYPILNMFRESVGAHKGVAQFHK